MNAKRGTKYVFSTSAEDYLKTTKFEGSVGDLKKLVEGAAQMIRREGGLHISPLNLHSVLQMPFFSSLRPRRRSPKFKVLEPEKIGRIKQRLEVIQFAKSRLKKSERVTTKMVDEYMGNASGGKSTANFLNNHHREIAHLIEEDFLSKENEYQDIVPGLKQMCEKLMYELVKRGF